MATIGLNTVAVVSSTPQLDLVPGAITVGPLDKLALTAVCTTFLSTAPTYSAILDALALSVSVKDLTIGTEAIVTVKTIRAVTLSSIDRDWSWLDVWGKKNQGVRIQAILFEPGSDNDIMIVRDGSKTGPRMFSRKASIANNLPTYYHGSLLKPVIDFSECTLNANHYLTIILE